MLHFRIPNISEYAQIVDLVNNADQVYFDIYSVEEAKDFCIADESIESLIQGSQTRKYICMYLDTTMIGYASYRFKNSTTVWLSMFYIDTTYQGNGYGTQFLTYLESELGNKGAQVIAFETDTRATWACEFYKKNNYIILDQYQLKKAPFCSVLDSAPVPGRYIFGKQTNI
ncbi:GNAT family N-acetyltransferase [Candidatus Gracilibacteria bacterium]|nr:GNAT family N-acetyltransferase [Candidatus Gracilibacteria bacterium]